MNPTASAPANHHKAPLYDDRESREEVHLRLIQDGRTDCLGSVRKVRTGLRLYRIKQEAIFTGWGFASFDAYVDDLHRSGDLPFGAQQAKKYLRIRNLPLDRLVGTDLSLPALLQLAIRHAGGEDIGPLAALLSRAGPFPAAAPRRTPRTSGPAGLACGPPARCSA